MDQLFELTKIMVLVLSGLVPGLEESNSKGTHLQLKLFMKLTNSSCSSSRPQRGSHCSHHHRTLRPCRRSSSLSINHQGRLARLHTTHFRNSTGYWCMSNHRRATSLAHLQTLHHQPRSSRRSNRRHQQATALNTNALPHYPPTRPATRIRRRARLRKEHDTRHYYPAQLSCVRNVA
jgi:hypothetical protein